MIKIDEYNKKNKICYILYSILEFYESQTD